MTHDNDTMGGMNTFGGWHEGEATPERRPPAETLSGAATHGHDGMPTLARRYHVLRRLGEGGMGSVWLAEDLKLDGKRFAIKMLPAVLAGKKAAYRQVKAEALMAMKLSHPNIATVRAFEEDEGGNPFLVMDYVEGEGLDEILAEKGKLSEEETLALLAPVASALDYAHAQGVVHRDVKPGNVMVRKDGTPFVLDFGIAREIQETLTRVTGKLSSGTLLYMSPEQLNGEKPRASQDVYSFAAMAYECLAGEPPFSRGQIEWQIMNKAPEPLAEGVGEALRAGILAGLAKEAKDRPATCAGVLGSAGGSQTQTARPGRLAPPAARPTNGTPRPSGRPVEKMTGEDVFVQKVRLGKELEAAGREHATAEEKAALEKLNEYFTAGEEALKMGEKRAAGDLFSQSEERLAEWRKRQAERLEKERLEKEAQERARRWAVDKRREAERKQAEERAARREAERKQAEERAARRGKAMKRVLGVAVMIALAGALLGGVRAVWRGHVARGTATRRARELGVGTRVGETKTVTLPGGATMEMVWCPPGTFMMGSPSNEGGRFNNEKEHQVTLSQGFWLGKREVTQRQWKSVMGSNPSYFRGDNLPVERVSWEDAQAFCRKSGMRLPTEAQWEYACRAGSTGPYAGTGKLEDMGWFTGHSGWKTHPVGTKQPNAWGLYDMHGNVLEWCADWWYGKYPSGAVTDPTGPASGSNRVRRGGSWNNYAQYCRSAYRSGFEPNRRSNYLGLRVALLPVQ